ncbi:MAG: SufD family Fe-S cluster assembly protein [Candidatus Cryptobacteroides sp.]
MDSKRIDGGNAVRELFILKDGKDLLPSLSYTVGSGSRLDLVIIVLPGVSARIPLTVELVGEGACANLSGIFLSNGNDAVDFDITVDHKVGGCKSSQLFNGVAAGNARCSFFGKITVATDAQKTEAFQTNRNIVLGDSARIETKPQLEIYADDVQCSHGATVGTLNEEEQYYMRSRGIPEDEAKVLQMISFVAPVIAALPDTDSEGKSCRENVAHVVEEAIRSI